MMMPFKSVQLDMLVAQVLTEITACFAQLPGECLAQSCSLVENAPRVFVSGVGRSGLCMRALAMRLMHLGKTVYVTGETNTPSIAAGDLLIIGSGSGQTATLLVMAEKARLHGAHILLFTTDDSSPLAALSDHQVIIPAQARKASKAANGYKSVQPMGTLFEQALLILCDCLILSLMQVPGMEPAQMQQRHANLE
jgi:6-phospho-3-hexuloisomerase